MNFAIAGYGYSQGGVATDPSIPLKNASLHVHGAFAAYSRSLDVWGRSGKVDLILPYGWVSGSAEVAGRRRSRVVDGVGDPHFRFSVNFWGAPALSLDEFAAYQQDVIAGASVEVSAPLGQYDADKLVNIGTNRWSVKPEVGISKALGRVIVELVPGVTFFTDNEDFLGGHMRAQEPIYSVQGHVIYAFRWGLWGAIDGTYYGGGRTTVDGKRGNDLQDNTRLGGTLAIPVDAHDSIKFYASTGVATRTGTSFDAVGIAWQYRSGGGL